MKAAKATRPVATNLRKHRRDLYLPAGEDKEFANTRRASGLSQRQGLVIAGLVVLLACGGIAVLRYLSIARNEVRTLQARLAAAATPDEIAATIEARRELEKKFAKIQADNRILGLYNKRLTVRVAKLRKYPSKIPDEVESDSEGATKSAIKEGATDNTAIEVPPRHVSATDLGDGNWFVDVGAYGRRSDAENRAARLNPSTGAVVLKRAETDGKSSYLVRIMGLANRAQAEKVAEWLQSEQNLTPLRVGKE